MRTLLIPDIHLRHEQVDKIIKHEAADKVIFMGDHFDQFKDTAAQNRQAALWVIARMIQHPEDEWIWGNHDLHYAWVSRHTKCSGYESVKEFVINDVVGRNWDKFRFYTWLDDKTLVSHAGLHPIHQCQDGSTKLPAWLEESAQLAVKALYSNQSHWLFAAGKARDGFAKKGGVTWLDWSDEFEPIEGLNQIVGHSVVDKPELKEGVNSWNYNLDTNGNHYGVWDGTKLTTKYAPDEILRWF